MLNEPASSPQDRPVMRTPVIAPQDENQQFEALRVLVETVLQVDRDVYYGNRPQRDLSLLTISPESSPVASFYGSLLTESEEAYARLDELCIPQNLLPVFREGEDHSPHTIHILSGRPNPKRSGWIINLILFIATVFSVLLIGAQIGISEAESVPSFEQCLADASSTVEGCLLPELWRGIPYAFSILLILGAHELGHYFAARYHKLAVTLPFFIPFPFGFFGTMGAFIQLRQPMRDRKVLLDVGAAGPLFGLLFAIPILVIGLATSPVKVVEGAGWVEGNSLLYALAKTIVLGRFYPSGGMDVYMNQFAQAGWTGLLVTALNLIPLGQLDGGHILYSIIGKRARFLYYPLILLMGVLVLGGQTVWLTWIILLFLFGRIYATPLNDLTPLDPRRRAIAWLALFVFIVIFVPVPFTLNDGTNPFSPDASLMLPALMVWVSQRRG